MRKPYGIYPKTGGMLLGLALAAGLATSADRINRIDIFDKADNHLMFVTFDYDAGGRNIGRSVYMSDSTFVRSTTFENDAQGKRVKENSLNYNGTRISSTAFCTDAGRPGINVFDQFGLDQLGGPVSYGSADQNTYSLYQKNAPINSMRYSYDGKGSLSRIDIMDKTGNLLYYTTVAPVVSAVENRGLAATPPLPSIHAMGKMRFVILVNLLQPAFVRVPVFTVDGRRVKTLVNKMCTAGYHRIPLDFSAQGIAAGVYVVYLQVEGSYVFSKRLVSMPSRLTGGAR